MNRTEFDCPGCNQKYLVEARPKSAGEFVGEFPFFCDCATEITVNATPPVLLFKMGNNGEWDFADTIGASL